MTLRPLVLLGLLGLVALAACGTGQDPAPEGEVTSAEVDGAAGGAGPDRPGLVLSVELPRQLVAGQPVTWRLTVANETDEDVALAFRSGQHGEVVLTDGDGAEAYRWSDGMMFTQALTEVPVEAAGEVTFDLAGALDVEPGTYRLAASIPSEPAPEAVSREVTVAG